CSSDLFVALHAHGIEQHVHIGKAALEDAEDVADGRAGGRGDQPDAPRQQGQRLFARGIEQALGLEPLLQLLEGELEGAEANRLDLRDVHLILATKLVDAYGAAHGNFEAVLGAKFDSAQLVAKAGAADLGLLVLQREVDVAGLRRVGVGDFSLDPQVLELAFEQIADARGELAYRPDLAIGHQVEGELRHGRGVYRLKVEKSQVSSVSTRLSTRQVTTGK